MNVHPSDPHSNVPKLGAYDPNKYAFDRVPLTVLTDESLTPGRPPVITQRTIGKYLQPLTRELVEVPPRPTVEELPDAVIEGMVRRDKAFWVDKPGANAYTVHDAYDKYEMTTDSSRAPHQDVFPRSYQYDVDCVKYRQRHACDGLTNPEHGKENQISAHCQNCQVNHSPGLKYFKSPGSEDTGQKRWRYYPDLNATLSSDEIRQRMDEVGRPFQHEACKWYNENFPSVKYDVVLRKFSH